MEEKKFITKNDEELIVEAIKTAENNTSGEIRVHIEPTCPVEDIFQRAKVIFEELHMDNTELKNGVLIYLAVKDRKFYIMGDSGINKVVPNDFWESTKELMKSYFIQQKYTKGLVEGILKAGEQLKKHFPYAADDVNELPDEISRG